MPQMSRKHLTSNKPVAKSGEDAKAFEVDKLAALLEKKEKVKKSLIKWKRAVKKRLL